MKDWIKRAAKTFAQAFLGALIPEVIRVLNGGVGDIKTAWTILFPFVTAALAAGISAVWNIALEHMSTQDVVAATAVPTLEERIMKLSPENRKRLEEALERTKSNGE